jgi:hypothetical protein
LKEITNFKEDATEVLDATQEEYYRVPEFDTKMFMPEHLLEHQLIIPPEDIPFKDDIDDLDDQEDDPFYITYKEEQFDDIQQLFHETFKKSGLQAVPSF